MLPSVLFIFLCVAKRTLATCSESSTSFSFSESTTETATPSDNGNPDNGGGGPPGGPPGGIPPFPPIPPPIPGLPFPNFNNSQNNSRSVANSTVTTLTLEEKVKLVTGLGNQGGLCSGNIPSVGNFNFSGLCIQESSIGVGLVDFVTAFPAGINTAATWQRSLFRARGVAMGQEHRGKGVNIALTPMVNLGRVPSGGSNWEGFGADPYLVGAAAYETVLGLQSTGVQAVAKKFINTEQETQRDLYSSNVDDRTQHELYLQPFIQCVIAGVAAVMCSSNLINGTYACENSPALNGMLKGQLGFRGFVMSDWYATHATTDANNGLDMTMPGDISPGSGTSYFGASLLQAVSNGTVTGAQLTEMATRILTSWYFLAQGLSGYPKTNFNSYNPLDPATNQDIDVQADHDTLVRQIDAAGTILLKNVNNALPLKAPGTLAIIGSDAGPAHKAGPNEFANQAGSDGILATGWGLGSVRFQYLVSPYEALQARARADQTTLTWFFDDFNLAGAGAAAMHQDVAIVFLQSDSGDISNTVDGNTGDRSNLTAWHNGDQLVLAVAAQNPNTIVVVHSVGSLIVEPWIDHPNVTALIWAGVGGAETGNSLVDILYGAVNPSGRLPYTIAKSASDYPAKVVTGTGNQAGATVINYSEGLFIDYRHFDQNNIAPRYEFGFGLSYTKFTYSNLEIVANIIQNDTNAQLEADWAAGQPTSSILTTPWLHTTAVNVTFQVKNTGSVAGTEIAQVYVHYPANLGEPPSQLRGFTDVELQPGESQTVMLPLKRFDLSIWDTVGQSYVRALGDYTLSVGASSRDFRLNGTIPI